MLQLLKQSQTGTVRLLLRKTLRSRRLSGEKLFVQMNIHSLPATVGFSRKGAKVVKNKVRPGRSDFNAAKNFCVHCAFAVNYNSFKKVLQLLKQSQTGTVRLLLRKTLCSRRLCGEKLFVQMNIHSLPATVGFSRKGAMVVKKQSQTGRSNSTLRKTLRPLRLCGKL